MHNGTSVSELRATSLFSWSFKQNARDTQMTTRVSFLASTLAFACTPLTEMLAVSAWGRGTSIYRADWSRTINYAKCSWRNFSSGERDFSYGEFSTEMDVKNWQYYCKKEIEHNILISHDPYSYWRQNVQNFEVKPWAAGEWLHLSFDVISTIDKSTDHGKLLLMFNGTRVGMLTNPEFALNTLNNLAWQTPSNHINTKPTNHKIPLWSLFQTKSTTWLYRLL